MANLKSNNQETTGEVITRFRQMPEYDELIRNTYYDADIIAAANRFFQSDEFDEVLTIAGSRQSQGNTVLDIGGGNGVAALSWCFAGYDVILAEPDPSTVVGYGAIKPILDSERYNINICPCFGEKLPFTDETFDIVYVRQVLHHLSDLAKMSSEVFRVLKKGGLFIATREHVLSKPEDLEIFLESHDLHKYTGTEHAYTLQTYLDSIRAGGFKDIKVYGQWDSVINYYPHTRDEVVDRFSHAIAKRSHTGRIGYTLTKILMQIPYLEKQIRRYFSYRESKPGQMYSFVAKKNKVWSK